jgi:hypothetical protein
VIDSKTARALAPRPAGLTGGPYEVIKCHVRPTEAAPIGEVNGRNGAHEDPFPPLWLHVRCMIRHGTFAETNGNERDAAADNGHSGKRDQIRRPDLISVV